MRAMIVGGGIGGLTAALSLHAAGIECSVVESAAALRPLGVGINLQPHAVRELTELGLGEDLAASGIATSYMTFTDRYGGQILALPRGKAAGYRWPQYSIHRGELQMILLAAVLERLGPEAVRTATRLEGFEQADGTVTATLTDVRSGAVSSERVDALIGADGIHSTVRLRLHGTDPLKWSGITMWRGVSECDPFLDDATVLVAGSNRSAKFVAYPVSARARGRGQALINWVAEVNTAEPGAVSMADWSREGSASDVLEHFGGWKLPWLDIRDVVQRSAQVLEYPMVDREPLPVWGSGLITLLGDAAHPMYPIGSNGGSQAILDARVLAHALATHDDVRHGLVAYERERREPANALVLAHRALPMERTITMVMDRAPGGFTDIAEVLTPAEIARMADDQRRITDMDVETLNTRPSWTV